jgi:hypothetical protein
MNSIKQKLRDNLLIGFILGIVSYSIVLYLLIHVIGVSVTETPENVSTSWTDVGGNINIEYYLEVSEDSIWVENVSTNRVYGGTYSQLDSLITIDNQ